MSLAQKVKSLWIVLLTPPAVLNAVKKKTLNFNTKNVAPTFVTLKKHC